MNMHFYMQTDSTHFKQVDLTVGVVVVLEAVEGVVVPVAVNGAHSWTGVVAAVKKPTMANADEDRKEKQRQNETEMFLFMCKIN